MEVTKLLYDQYRFENNLIKEDIQFDMIKRIEAYRRNVDLYNSYGLPKTQPRPTLAEVPRT